MAHTGLLPNLKKIFLKISLFERKRAGVRAVGGVWQGERDSGLGMEPGTGFDLATLRS